MSKIVVTGGSGRLGQQVIQELLGGNYEILSVDRVAPPTKLCPSRIVDLTRSSDVDDAMRDADGVIHLGAYKAPDIAPDGETFSNNVTATYNVLHAGVDLGIRRAVTASSTAAFGFLYARRPWLPDYLPLDEKYPCRPQDPYGLSKVVGEKIADSFANVSEMSIASLRFPGIHFDFTYRSFSERWQNPSEKIGRFWSYIDARDAAAACRLALETDIPGHEVFVVAAPTSTVSRPTDELMREYLPGVRKARADLTGNWSGADSTKAEKFLGFKAQHVWENYLKEQQ